jgi:hypothetical protein
MVDISPELFLINVVPYIVSTAILAIAFLICFKLSRKRKSQGLFLITLAFLIKLVVDGAWNLFYWLVLGGPFQALVLFQRGLSASQIGAEISVTFWVAEVIGTAAYVSMLALIIYGAVQITEEHLISQL